VTPYWLYTNLEKKYSLQNRFRKQRKTEKDQRNYTTETIHEDIADFHFALRIPIANSN
jgi:hypothetical protein